MKKLFVMVAGALLLATPGAWAQGACVGDCNDDGTVAINELISGGNIALGSAALSTCEVFDASGNGTVEIAGLIQAVCRALNGCDGCDGGPPPPNLCGNGTMEAGEECDDGNN